MTDGVVLQAAGLVKTYRDGETVTEVLKGIDLTFNRGEFVSLMGPSGSGKSTLLTILGTLLKPTAGTIELVGNALSTLDDHAVTRFRNRHIGFVFQFHHLLREFTALENVMMPALLTGRSFPEARQRAQGLLREVGLEHRETHKPRQLSGGEQQRVAVARALMNEPLVLLADEPSGNLDTQTSLMLHDLLFSLRERREVSLVVVTHNHDLAGRADRILVLSEGRLQQAPGV
jgi:lipoprotein-releasing system ATP-binding protein